MRPIRASVPHRSGRPQPTGISDRVDVRPLGVCQINGSNAPDEGLEHDSGPLPVDAGPDRSIDLSSFDDLTEAFETALVGGDHSRPDAADGKGAAPQDEERSVVGGDPENKHSTIVRRRPARANRHFRSRSALTPHQACNR